MHCAEAFSYRRGTLTAWRLEPQQLNWRINDDVPGIDLVKWLNSHPEVQAVMDEHYDGRPISVQNLSEWRKYGYQKWLALHTVPGESHNLSEDSEERPIRFAERSMRGGRSLNSPRPASIARSSFSP